MRLISDFPEERKAYTLCQFLEQQGVNASYEATKEGHHCVWIIEEDEFEKGRLLLAEFLQLPEEQQRKVERPKNTTDKIFPGFASAIRNNKANGLGRTAGRSSYAHIPLGPRRIIRRGGHALTHFLLLICCMLFFWNIAQETGLVKREGKIALQIGLTPLQEKLMFDYPTCYTKLQSLLQQHPLESVDEIATLPSHVQQEFTAANQCSYWKGLYPKIQAYFMSTPEQASSPTLFEKIRQGEIWRLFTPCLLHRDLLHILFNMSWLVYLGRQIEERIGKGRMLLLIVLIGVISNTAQYLMSGPYFLGFSGVAVGLVGFIWMRQRMSPWEGYPLSNGTTLFLVIFVLAMVLLDWISFGMQLIGKTPFAGSIANTAHISGGLIGVLLARIPLFAHNTNLRR